MKIWQKYALAVFAGVLLCAGIVGSVTAYRATRVPVDTAPVNRTIEEGIISADEERRIIEEHRTKIEREVVVIREKALTRVLAYSNDELASVALGRIERFRRAVGTDSASRPPGVGDAD